MKARILLLIVCSATVGYMVFQSISDAARDQQEPRKNFERNGTQARELLQQAQRELQKDPHSAHWRAQSALAHLALGETDAAERGMREAIRLDADYPTYYYQLSKILEIRGKRVEQQSVLSKAVALDPANPLGHFEFGRVLEKNGYVSQALQHLEIAFGLLQGLNGQKYYTDAKGSYPISGLREVVDKEMSRLRSGAPMKTGDEPAYRVRALTDSELAALNFDPRSVLERARQEMQRNPHAARWHREAAWAHYLIQDSKAAKAEILEARKSDPNDVTTYHLAALIEAEPEQKIDYLKQALQIDSSNPLSYFLLGQVYEQKGDVAEALANYQVCLVKLAAYETVQEDYVDVHGAHFDIRNLKQDATAKVSALKRRQ